MEKNFSRALKLVLEHEGGYSNHPDDPGGPTMKGVIQRVYDGYRRHKGMPVRSVKQLEEGELADIYRTLYWNKIEGDELPSGIDYAVFDAAVNSGFIQAGKWLQRALNETLGKPLLKDDGIIGPATLGAARDAKSPSNVIGGMCARRLFMLKRLKTWRMFGEGWKRRVDEVEHTARIMGVTLIGHNGHNLKEGRKKD